MTRALRRLLTTCAAALTVASPSHAATQAQDFALGVVLQRPTAQAEAFLQDVRSLRDADDATLGDGAVGRLAEAARTLRDTERTEYDTVARQLQGMGAPVSLYAWAGGITQLLSQTQIVPKDAKPYVKDDPPTATVLATIDEADAVRVIADRNAETVDTWLKVTQGAAGVWAVTLGRLTAGMQVAADTSHPFLLPRQTVLTLHDTAPAGTPRAVLQILAALAPRGRGNLSQLVHLPTVTIAASAAGPPAQALLAAYGMRNK